MSSLRLTCWDTCPQLVALFGDVMRSSGCGSYLVKVDCCGEILGAYNPVWLRFCLCVQVPAKVNKQLNAPAIIAQAIPLTCLTCHDGLHPPSLNQNETVDLCYFLLGVWSLR